MEVASCAEESGRRARRRTGGASRPRGRAPPALPPASLSVSPPPRSRPGWAGRVALGAGLRVPTFLPPSLLPGVPAAGPMSAERREREAARSARPSHGAPAAAPKLSLRPWSLCRVASPRLLAARSPGVRRPRAPRGGHPRALGREDAPESGAGRGGGSSLSKMRDGNRAAVQPLLPHHGLHLPAPAQPAPRHPARPGECGGEAGPLPKSVRAWSLPGKRYLPLPPPP